MVVGLGEYAVSTSSKDKIKTFALSSCVAVTAYSPSRKIGGMIHVVLPQPEDKKEISNPGYYAETGIPLLIRKICREYGCRKDDLHIQIFGGADSIHANDMFKIGRRNIEAVTRALSEIELEIRGQSVGGHISRTIELDIATGQVNMSTQSISF